jgi:UDP-glucose 4-epimerase
MKKVLITGGAGYIGSFLANKLIKNNYKVSIIDNLSTGRKNLVNKKSIFYKLDLQNKNKIKKIFNKNKFDTVFHLAASLNIQESDNNKKKYFGNNVKVTSFMIDLCNQYNIKNFIFASSCSVFGNHNRPVSEEDLKKPISYYAETKLISENEIKKKLIKTKYALLRYFNVVGADKKNKIGEINNHDHLFKNYSRECLKKKPIFKIYGSNYDTHDGSCIRDYIHINDLIDIHMKTLKYLDQKRKNLELNCGYGKGYSVLEICKKFKKKTKNSQILINERRVGDPRIAICDNKKMKKILNFRPKFNKIELMVNQSIEWENFLKIYKL